MNLANRKHQKTKIVATLGPASSSKEVLEQMIVAGADVFRLNFSHGSHEVHQKTINTLIKINEEHNINIGILCDLQGPKLRVGEIENNGIEIKKDDIITFVNEPCVGTKEKIYMSYENFARDVQVGERVMLDDGKLQMTVVETDGDSVVKLKVVYGGILSSKKGVNLPETKISLPSLTKKDLEDLEFILTQPINWIALSFVRHANDVIELKEKIKAAGHFAKVISKIEKPEAIADIKNIIKATDAIMIARGDLGVEVPMEKLPAMQKDIIRRCIRQGRPVIVATQMMESMITNPSPTRAEITDVANAVLDGCDAVMLSGETSVGKYPVGVVEAMSKIIAEAEQHYELQTKRPKANVNSETYYSDTICYAAARMAENISAKAILGITVSGHTAFKVSSYRPNSKIYIFSSVKPMLATMNLIWGVQTFFYDKFSSTDETISDLTEILQGKNLLEQGDVVVNTASMPLAKRFRTNALKITIVD